MSRYRFSQGIFLMLMIGILSMGADARRRSDPAYDGAVNFGSQIVFLQDGCIALDGSVSSGSFFEDLKRVASGNQLEFEKNGSAVTKYPESLTTTIHIVGGECADALSRP